MREDRHLNNTIKHKIASSSHQQDSADGRIATVEGKVWDRVTICQIQSSINFGRGVQQSFICFWGVCLYSWIYLISRVELHNVTEHNFRMCISILFFPRFRNRLPRMHGFPFSWNPRTT